MTFRPGDVVMVGKGEVHWDVIEECRGLYLIRSGMSERHRWASPSELKQWCPDA